MIGTPRARAELGRVAPICVRCAHVEHPKAGVPIAPLVEEAIVIREGTLYRVIAKCHGAVAIFHVEGDLGEAERKIKATRVFEVR